MSRRILAVLGCGHNDCGQYVESEGEFGRVVASVPIGDAEVWEVRWPDGSIYLLTTDEIAGVTRNRPPDSPPGEQNAA